MKKYLIVFLLLASPLTFTSCDDIGGSGCGTYNGHVLHKGPQGGCYYENSNGNKTYVDRSECDC